MQRIFIKSLLTDLKVNFDTKANVFPPLNSQINVGGFVYTIFFKKEWKRVGVIIIYIFSLADKFFPPMILNTLCPHCWFKYGI